jgi:all-trans-8'-apo-beta-carotenal 15,15'-oxygenase
MNHRFLILFYLLGPLACIAFSTVPSRLTSVRSIDNDKEFEARERAKKAKDSWHKIAFAPTERRDEVISLLTDSKSVRIFDPDLFEDFTRIRGTFFINGLSSARIGPGLVHPMESHGYVKSLAFDGKGSLHLKASVVQTPLAQKERYLKCPVARGIMSSLAGSEYPQCLNNALAPSERDTANLVATLWPPSSILDSHVDPVLIVAGDNGLPYCIDPKTMNSIGSLEFCVPTLAPKLRGKKILAHMRHDKKRQRLVLCSTTFDLYGNNKDGNTVIEFMELDTNFELVHHATYKTRFIVVHDWMITENYYVVPKNPARVQWSDMTKFIMGAKLGVDVFEMDHDALGEILLIPRHDSEEPVKEIKADSFFNIFHMGPCHENKGEGTMTVYANVFDHFRFGGEMGLHDFDPIEWSSSEVAPPPRFDKFVIDLKTDTLKQRERLLARDEETGADIPVDMPTFNSDGNANRYVYFAGASRPEGWFPFRSVVKMDVLAKNTYNWDAGDESVVSETTFIPKSDPTSEDDGFLVCIVHNTANERSELVVWDATVFHSGPIGVIDLGELMPWCVHGSFSPNYIA